MLRLFGEASLFLALLFAILQSTLPIIGYYRHHSYCLASARPCAFGQAFFIIFAYALLTIAFLKNDFSIAYVAANSHSTLPLMYQLTAVWGAHEGSILLWIVILNIWTASVTLFIPQKKFLALILAILGIISLCFLCFLIFTSNPFVINTSLQTGLDLNPLLQDPGFVIHPPMLYMGYVGFSVAFAIALAALLNEQLDATSLKIIRQFAIAAWCFLTLGITLGSWWAYRVLGWGGFWFWDPVENASLLPWIAGTALIHILLLANKRHIAKKWAILLAIISFALSLLGTFLVRSGVLISAHTFANDPKRGIFLLLLLAFLLTLALFIYALRISKMPSSPLLPFTLLSRETSLLLNSGLLLIAMLTILLGTLYPLIIDALHLGMISVGPPYFNKVMLPFVFILLFFMGLGPLCQWQTQRINAIWQTGSKNLLVSVMSAIILQNYFSGHLDIIVTLCLSLSFWLILNILPGFRYLKGMFFAHLGFAVLIIGILLSSLLSQEKEVRIHPGDAVTIGPYQFFFLTTESVLGENYRGIRAHFDVLKNHYPVANLYPEKRIYPIRDMVMTKVDIHPGIFRDLYIALGEPLDHDFWSVRLYYKPFIRWIWLGGLIMILGGLFAMIQHKREVR